jgi:hypothetical protein
MLEGVRACLDYLLLASLFDLQMVCRRISGYVARLELEEMRF